MKRLFVILLVLCPLVVSSALWAQVYTTSSASYNSYSTTGLAMYPTHSDFRRTSTYISVVGKRNPAIASATAPLRVANGTVKTVASQLSGNWSVDNIQPKGDNLFSGSRRAPFVPDETPLSDGLDVFILFLLLCAGYAIYISRKRQSSLL